jgi:hypothetical protein
MVAVEQKNLKKNLTLLNFGSKIALVALASDILSKLLENILSLF